jgi:hypothetical protein
VIAGTLTLAGRRAASPTAGKAKVQLPGLALTGGGSSEQWNKWQGAQRPLAAGKDAVYAGCDLEAPPVSAFGWGDLQKGLSLLF